MNRDFFLHIPERFFLFRTQGETLANYLSAKIWQMGTKESFAILSVFLLMLHTGGNFFIFFSFSLRAEGGLTSLEIHRHGIPSANLIIDYWSLIADVIEVLEGAECSAAAVGLLINVAKM